MECLLFPGAVIQNARNTLQRMAENGQERPMMAADECRIVGVSLFDRKGHTAADHRINACANRAVLFDTLPHQIEVVEPFHAEERVTPAI